MTCPRCGSDLTNWMRDESISCGTIVETCFDCGHIWCGKMKRSGGTEA